ncbi:MAG: hypothetical protein WCL01_08895 [Comamonadaceae bacterium]
MTDQNIRTYKGYVLHCGAEQSDDPGMGRKFRMRLRIGPCNSSGSVVVKTITQGENEMKHFETAAEAEASAYELGKKWIDENHDMFR